MPKGLKVITLVNVAMLTTVAVVVSKTGGFMFLVYTPLPFILLFLVFIRKPFARKTSRLLIYFFCMLLSMIIVGVLAKSSLIGIITSRILAIIYVFYFIGVRGYLNEDIVKKWYLNHT